MNGIFIIAHAPLASALRQCVLHVFPDAAAGLAAFDVQPDAPLDATLLAAGSALALLNSPQALVLTDVVGATPCNVAQKLVLGTCFKLIAGVNLPMLLRSVTYRNEPLAALVELALAGGRQGVIEVASMAGQNQV
jgi:PTS system ascorbate-specific IIA component